MGERPTKSHDCMKQKICVMYQQEGIDLPSSENVTPLSQGSC